MKRKEIPVLTGTARQRNGTKKRVVTTQGWGVWIMKSGKKRVDRCRYAKAK